MQLLGLLTCFIHLSQGAPHAAPQFLSWFTTNSSSLLDNMYTYHSYLPESAQRFINETIEDGKDVAYDVYDDVKEEVVKKTADNVESLTGVLSEMFNKFSKITNNVDGIITNDADQTDLDEQDLNELKSLKDKLRTLEDKIEVDMEKDKSVTEDVEKLIQQFLTSTREMVVELGNGGEIFWNKMKQLEIQFYRVKIAIADGSGDLKEEVSELFKTLKKVDLKQIGAVEEQDQDQGIEVPRDF
eukprot:TRINITY_DN12106_c1_g1_i3.p1 TRINITY_DN12106_c1_g1~~TRINITY_DN12106_c1_g1_i3.p1  ORF type:complete len:257 (+),score=83.82 TRINITY_DN12106_c1_g1_i3:46-771(+)